MIFNSLLLLLLLHGWLARTSVSWLKTSRPWAAAAKRRPALAGFFSTQDMSP